MANAYQKLRDLRAYLLHTGMYAAAFTGATLVMLSFHPTTVTCDAHLNETAVIPVADYTAERISLSFVLLLAFTHMALGLVNPPWWGAVATL